MIEVPSYERHTSGKLQVPTVNPSLGKARLYEQISNSAEKMAGQLQDVSEKLYLTSFENTARKNILDIYNQNKTDPEQLKVQYNAAFDGLTKDASPLIKAELQARYEMLSAPYISHATESLTRLNNDKLKEQSLTLMNESINGLEHNASFMLSNNPETAFQASRAAQLQMSTLDKMLSQTDSDGMPLFSAEQRVKYRENAQQDMMKLGLRRWFDEQPNKIAAMEQIVKGDKKFKFYDPQGNQMQEINPLDEMDMRSFMQLNDYMDNEIKQQISLEKKQKDIVDVQKYLSGDLLVDPKDKSATKALDVYFDEVEAPKMAGMDPVSRANAITEYVSKVGVMPSSIKGLIRSTTRNGSVEQQAFAADIIGRLAESQPFSLDDMPEKDLSYGIMVSDSIRSGLTAEEAVDKAQKQFDPLKEDIIKSRKEDLSKEKYNAESRIKDLMDDSYFFSFFSKPSLEKTPDLSRQAITEYQDIYRQEYLITGDKEAAKKSAGEIFKRTYGVSEISGKSRVVKYPPEKYYNVKGLPNGWMREQLIEDVHSFDSYKDTKPEDIVLTPDTITAREATSGAPSYIVMIKQKDGTFSPLMDNDRNIGRVTFNPQKYIERVNQGLDEQKKVTVAQAMKLREGKGKILEEEKLAFDFASGE